MSLLSPSILTMGVTWLPESASTLAPLTTLLPQIAHMGHTTPTTESLNNFYSIWAQLCDNLPDFFHCSLISRRRLPATESLSVPGRVVSPLLCDTRLTIRLHCFSWAITLKEQSLSVCEINKRSPSMDSYIPKRIFNRLSSLGKLN